MKQSPEKKPLFISVRVRLLVGFTLLFAAVFAIAFYWFYTFASNMALQRIREDVKDTLLAAADGVNAEEFAAFVKEVPTDPSGYPNDPRYWNHIHWLASVNKIEPRAFVYTWIASPEAGYVDFIGSHGAALNPPEGAKYLEHYKASDAMLSGMKETLYRNNFRPYADKWGKWVTAYTPIKTEQGEIVGGLGIDFKADYVYSVQQAIRSKVVVAFTVTYLTLFVLVWIVSSGLTRPIISLTRLAGRIGEGDYDQDLSGLTKGRLADEISKLASDFAVMVGKVYQREQTLRRQVEDLRIEIDESKKKHQVNEIVESDFFRDLQSRADRMRDRKKFIEQTGTFKRITPEEMKKAREEQ